MKETVGLHSSFEDIYNNRHTFPDVYKRVGGLAQAAGAANPEATPRIEIKSSLDQAIAEYKIKPHTPERVTRFQKVLWAQISEITGVDVVVPVVVETRWEIEKREKKGKGIILIPQGYEGQNQRRLIAAGFKLVGNKYVPEHWSVQDDNQVKNDIIHVGYRFVDMQIDAPYLGTNEEQAKEAAIKEDAEGMNESEYLLAGLQSKLITGQYLDEGSTWSRLLSSSCDGRVVRADFGSDGDFDFYSGLRPGDHYVNLGARFSSGVKTA